ncbi:galactofuranose ABC transporter, permease protein YjfF [Paracoccus shanxieyensis]|uniref:Sugar ABC transporter permease YjfF n=1 Tax=Paracoccus shanxieyensis TaxID=2675752 RepID=A0A6L6J015_9RHOB|nr:galactofuranose ABC transporter, permease protein YjfF [Paracoccus shanxieyensis]MTH65519.1 sugar ABC transporter permease YjfF [Paracoccus shanxieyensis]MTH88685.1 sugar ABC transporter permease YjfF [Paracoccus shanxieyensis]
MIRARTLPFVATVAIFLLAYALCVAQFPNMLSWRVAGNLLTDNAFLGIAAVGMTFVIISGGIDLSVGSVIAFTSVLVAVLIRAGVHPALAFALALALSTAFGALMGLTIHALKMPPFVVTLAGMFLARGAAFLLSTDSVPISHDFLRSLKTLYIALPDKGRLTFLAMLMLAAFAIGVILAHRTRFGANVYALGGSPQSAELMGVPIRRTTVQLYAFSGFMAGLSGLAYTLYTSAGYSLATVGVELDAIAAVVVGGTLLTGGAGLVLGTLFGVLIQGLIQTYIVFDGTLSSWWTKIVVGILLFTFIILQRLILLVSERRAMRRVS